MKDQSKKNSITKPSDTVVADLEKSIKDFTEKVDGFVYPLIIPQLQVIDEDVLFEIYSDLCIIGKKEKMHILLYSYGGDAHTAFHIGRLLQDYSKKELIIYVLREAKSAATLISCAADKIIFSEISELGPMDPQIKHSKISERFSPLAIKHTFELLQEETRKGHTQIVNSLTEKLPDPLILGELLKSLETGKDYLLKLMRSRMFNGKNEDDIKSIAEKLVTGYPDHGYCIDYTEAKSLGLEVEKISDNLSGLLFEIMKNYKKVWNKIDQHIRLTKDKDDKEFAEAVSLYTDLKKLSKNVIEYQKNRDTRKKVIDNQAKNISKEKIRNKRK